MYTTLNLSQMSRDVFFNNTTPTPHPTPSPTSWAMLVQYIYRVDIFPQIFY